jgi:hypothetical protein
MGGALSKKLGPLPRWAWAAIVVAVVFFYYRHKASTAAGVTGATAASVLSSNVPVGGSTDLTGSGVPSTAGVAADGGTSSATSDILSSLGAQNATLIDALVGLAENNANNAAAIASQPATTSSVGGGGDVPPGASSDPGGGGGGATTPVTVPQPGGSGAPVIKHVAAAPFGGVTSTKKLKSGAVVTTYKSGRKVEKAPGKKAYVIHK